MLLTKDGSTSALKNLHPCTLEKIALQFNFWIAPYLGFKIRVKHSVLHILLYCATFFG